MTAATGTGVKVAVGALIALSLLLGLFLYVGVPIVMATIIVPALGLHALASACVVAVIFVVWWLTMRLLSLVPRK